MFQDMAEKLPAGWMVNVQADASMAWKAFVYRASAPESRPLFTVCRWSDRVGLFVQWADGSSYSVVTCTQLRPILDMVPSSIFAFAAVSLATESTTPVDSRCMRCEAC